MTIDQQIESARAELDRSIDVRASYARTAIRIMAQKTLDEISVKVGWMIRSNAQRIRYMKARKKGEVK